MNFPFEICFVFYSSVVVCAVSCLKQFCMCLKKRKVKVSHSLKAVGAVRSRGPIYLLTQWMKGKAHPSSFLALFFPDLKKILYIF